MVKVKFICIEKLFTYTEDEIRLLGRLRYKSTYLSNNIK